MSIARYLEIVSDNTATTHEIGECYGEIYEMYIKLRRHNPYNTPPWMAWRNVYTTHVGEGVVDTETLDSLDDDQLQTLCIEASDTGLYLVDKLAMFQNMRAVYMDRIQEYEDVTTPDYTDWSLSDEEESSSDMEEA